MDWTLSDSGPFINTTHNMERWNREERISIPALSSEYPLEDSRGLLSSSYPAPADSFTIIQFNPKLALIHPTTSPSSSFNN